MEPELPEGVTLQRSTVEFDSATVPPGLLGAHRIAPGVWGVLRVNDGSLTFVWEEGGAAEEAVGLSAGESMVIPPGVAHRVRLESGARFVVQFYR